MTLARACGWFIVVTLVVSAPATAVEATSREVETCESEQLLFGVWSFLAGSPKPGKVLKLPAAERVSLVAGDGRKLEGFRLGALDQPARGYVLVVQGNGWLASTIAPFLTRLQSLGLDVFVYDFRGYGLSKPGRRRFAAFLEDYREIADHLNRRAYGESYLYGFSFGGVVLMNALTETGGYTRVILDATPSRLEDFEFECTVDYNPIARVPQTCSNFVVLTGTEDGLVSPERAQPLVDAMLTCGADWISQEFGHPFQGESEEVRDRRVEALGELMQRQAEEEEE